MSTTVIPPTSQSYWVPSYGSPSAFSFIFRKGSDKYVALGRVAQTRPDLYPDGPAMAKSTDGGATWTLYEEPVLLTNVGDLGPAYDCAFDGSGGTLTCFFDEIRAYDVPSGTYTYTCYVAEFDFATDSWGAKRAPLMLTSSPSPLSSGYFSSRPDGKFVLVLTTAAGVEYWILNGSTWSGPTSVASGTVFDLCVASDGVMHINVNGTYHHIDSSGSVLAVDGSGIFPVGPSRIKSNALTVPARSSGIVISRGTPPNAAIWTNQTVTALATIGYPAVYVTESPALGVDIAFEYDDTAGANPEFDVAEFLHLSAASAVPAVYYVADTQKDIMRTEFVSGAWSTPASVYTVPAISTGKVMQLAVVDSSGGGQIGARYYAE